eukprot:GHVU01081617.1.p1 GENE.GHVU01081617.1~~GHVU01081617.1.p1  ORF type:complete len:505 (+),score=71.06 GHVU01081617.1:75-1589(+)
MWKRNLSFAAIVLAVAAGLHGQTVAEGAHSKEPHKKPNSPRTIVSYVNEAGKLMPGCGAVDTAVKALERSDVAVKSVQRKRKGDASLKGRATNEAHRIIAPGLKKTDNLDGGSPPTEGSDDGECRIEELYMPHLNMQIIDYRGCEGLDPAVLSRSFQDDACVKSEERDSLRYPSAWWKFWESADRIPQVDDPLVPDQKWWNGTYSVQAPQGIAAYGKQPDQFPVAVIDFGFERDHEDLKNRWFEDTPEKLKGGDACTNNKDDDGNGLVDDCGGKIFTTDGKWSGSHGTEVSGCIAAEHDNTLGIAGVCPFCKVMPLRFNGYVSEEIQAIDYVIATGVKVINMSYGGAASTAERDAILAAGRQGVVVVAAAGNENCNIDKAPKACRYAGYPAAYSDTVPTLASIGAHEVDGDSAGERASFSNYGANRVTTFAPGRNILTTKSGSISEYAYVSGTSFSSPITAGVVAMIMSKYPSLTAAQVVVVLANSCVLSNKLTGMCAQRGELS